MKVIICDKLDDNAVSALKANYDVTDTGGISREELLGIIHEYDVAVIRSATKMTADIMEVAKNLKLIVRAGVGLDNVDREAAKARGIEVRNTPDATSVTVAELAIGLMISLSRHVVSANNSTKSGKWEKKLFSGTELYEKTVGIIGFGRIGQEVAKRAKAFHMDILIHDPTIDHELTAALEVKEAALETLYKEADYISIHCPLTETTKHLINDESLTHMKKTAYVVNCARGGIVDEQAIATAVQEGVIAGAAFDVFENEPLNEDSPLLKVDRIICMPHIGGATQQGQLRAGAEVVRIVNGFVEAM